MYRKIKIKNLEELRKIVILQIGLERTKILICKVITAIMTGVMSSSYRAHETTLNRNAERYIPTISSPSLYGARITQ